MSARKILLLYVGPDYQNEKFTQSDVSKIIASNATDFLFLNANEINYAKANDLILREEWVTSETNIPNSVFDTTATTEHIAQIRQQMVEQINKIATWGTTTRTLTEYVDRAVELAKWIRAQKADAKFWFGFPPYLLNCSPAAIRYNYYYYDYVFNPVKTKMTEAGYWSNVEGFYFGEEDIVAWYTRFNTANVSTQFDNVVVRNMKYLSDLVHGVSKKFMWIPFYRNDYRATRFGYVINRTNIFDIAIIQPNYYFKETESWISSVDSCVQAQAFKNGSTTIGGSKISATEIGPEMEADARLTETDFRNRFQSYVNTFGKYITGVGATQRPVAFYAGGPAAFRNTTYQAVSQFFQNGTVTYN